MARTGPGIRLTRVALVACFALAMPAAYLLIQSSASLERIASGISGSVRSELLDRAGAQSARVAAEAADALSAREPGVALTGTDLDKIRIQVGATSIQVADAVGTMLSAGVDPDDPVRAEALVGAGPMAGSRVTVAIPVPDVAGSLQVVDRTLRDERAHLAWRAGGLAVLGLALGLLALLAWQWIEADRGAPLTSDAAPAGKGLPATAQDRLGELAVSRPFLEQLLESTHDGVFFLSPDFQVIRANRQALAMLDYGKNSSASRCPHSSPRTAPDLWMPTAP